MSRCLLRSDKSVRALLEELTSAAARVARRSGAEDPQLPMLLEAELKEVLRRDMMVSDICGLSTICDDAEFFEPFSEEALALDMD